MSTQALIRAITRKSLLYAQDVVEPYSRGAMDSLIRILRPAGQGSYDHENRKYTLSETSVIYTDSDFPALGAPAGIEPATGPMVMNLGEEEQFWSSIRVHIPERVSTLPRVEDVVEICYNRTAGVVGRQFEVTDVQVGGRLSGSITMSAIGIAPSRNWETP